MKETRQQKRTALWGYARPAVNDKNLAPELDQYGRFAGRYRGMIRRDRRKLARAYFAGSWKNRSNDA